MPYRRLPNTDMARLKVLRTAVEKNAGYSPVIALQTYSEARNFLPRFESAHIYYQQCLDNQIQASRKYQPAIRNARMYVSHFIQVLNLAVIRGEIKTEYKDYYGLPREANCVPDLTNDSAVLEWGGKVIAGERERLRKGGVPIYNPTIAKVSVHYEIFKDGYERQKSLQMVTARSLEKLASMREKADAIILDVWNQVERHFESLAGKQRLEKCREYGVIYYYRTGEKRTEE